MVEPPKFSFGFEERSSPGFSHSFADERHRAHLSPIALKALQGIAAHWRLRGHEVAALLGVSPSTAMNAKTRDFQ